MKHVLFLLVATLAGSVALRGQNVLTLCDSGCTYALKDLQRAVDDSSPGDVITISGTATTASGLVLRNKTNPDKRWITLRSANLTNLPAGQRVAAGDSNLATITYTSKGNLAMRAEPSASYYRFEGIRFMPLSGDPVFNIVQFGTITSGTITDHEISDLVHDIEFDRCAFSGYPGQDGPYRAVMANSGRLSITNSAFNEIKGVNYESQIIAGWNASGPFYLRNNLFEGSSIDTLFGGAPPNIRGLRAKDLYFGGNYFYRPWRWRYTNGTTDPSGNCLSDVNGGEYYLNRTSPSFWNCQNGQWVQISEDDMAQTIIRQYKAGSGAPSGGCSFENQTYKDTSTDQNPWWICNNATGWRQSSWGDFAFYSFRPFYQKNHFELKNAERALVEGNVIQNSWLPASLNQHGAAFLFNQVDNDNYYGPLGVGDPSAVVSNVWVRNNIARNTPWGVSNGVIGRYFYPISGITVENNLFAGLGDEPQSMGDVHFMQLGAQGRYRVLYNTVIALRNSGGSVFDLFAKIPEQQIDIIGNILPYLQYGFRNDTGSGNGPNAIDASLNLNRAISKNVVVDQQRTSSVISNLMTASLAPFSRLVPCATCSIPLSYDNNGISDVGFMAFGNGNYRLSPSSKYAGAWAHGRPAGADIDSVYAATENTIAGGRNPYLDFIVRDVRPRPDSADIRFTAPSGDACGFVVSTRPDLVGPVFTGNDTGGDQDRLVTIPGLSAASRYYYAITCGTYRKSGAFLTTLAP